MMNRALTGIAIAALIAPAVTHARDERWRDVFAAERDTVVFFTADGALLRAPFGLANAETLWAPPRGQHLVRLAVNPDGSRIAWIARGFDGDTTRLWVWGPWGARVRARYFAARSLTFEFIRAVPDVPSTDDVGARGARLVQPGALARRYAANTLAWSADSRTVMFGYDGGIAATPGDAGSPAAAESLIAVSMEALAPSPMMLIDGIQLRGRPDAPRISQAELERGLMLGNLRVEDGRTFEPASRGSYLLGPGRDGWIVCGAADLASSHLRALGASTVWWSKGNVIHAIRSATCEPVGDTRAPADVVWLGFDEAHDALLVASGRDVFRRPEGAGTDSIVLSTDTPIGAAFRSRTTSAVALVTRDSLVVWDPGSGRSWRFARRGLDPCTLFEGPGGQFVVALDRGAHLPPRLARADRERGHLIEVDTPVVRGGVIQPTPDGAWILIYDPASNPPRSIRAYDVRTGLWHTVENPDLAGWEPLANRR